MTAQEDQYISVTIHSTSSGTVGRSINNTRNHFTIIDGSGIAEAVTSGESFLAGVSSCGVNLIEQAAVEEGIHLQYTDVKIVGLRDRESPQDFASVEMTFHLVGPSPEDAAALVARYQANCPLYRTVEKAWGVGVQVTSEELAAVG